MFASFYFAQPWYGESQISPSTQQIPLAMRIDDIVQESLYIGDQI